MEEEGAAAGMGEDCVARVARGCGCGRGRALRAFWLHGESGSGSEVECCGGGGEGDSEDARIGEDESGEEIVGR
jgi:hypothetical protein